MVPKVSPLTQACAALLVLLWLGNYLSVQVGYRPFVYCWMEPWLETDGLVNIVTLLAIAAAVLAVVKGGKAAGGVVLLIVALLLVPAFMDAVWRHGATCAP